MAGTDYVALMGRGTTLKYYDQGGNLVTLRVKAGAMSTRSETPAARG